MADGLPSWMVCFVRSFFRCRGQMIKHGLLMNVHGLNIAGALRAVVSRSCSLRSQAARATAPFGRGRVQSQPARPPMKLGFIARSVDERHLRWLWW